MNCKNVFNFENLNENFGKMINEIAKAILTR